MLSTGTGNENNTSTNGVHDHSHGHGFGSMHHGYEHGILRGYFHSHPHEHPDTETEDLPATDGDVTVGDETVPGEYQEIALIGEMDPPDIDMAVMSDYSVAG